MIAAGASSEVATLGLSTYVSGALIVGGFFLVIRGTSVISDTQQNLYDKYNIE